MLASVEMSQYGIQQTGIVFARIRKWLIGPFCVDAAESMKNVGSEGNESCKANFFFALAK